MRKKFRSKIDLWLIVVFAAMPILPFYDMAADGDILTSSVLLVACVLPIVLLFPCYYLIEGDTLLVKSGILVKGKININSITAVSKSRNWLSSPALSRDRLKVEYKGDFVLISPKDKAGFVAALCEINPEIKCSI